MLYFDDTNRAANDTRCLNQNNRHRHGTGARIVFTGKVPEPRSCSDSQGAREAEVSGRVRSSRSMYVDEIAHCISGFRKGAAPGVSVYGCTPACAATGREPS